MSNNMLIVLFAIIIGSNACDIVGPITTANLPPIGVIMDSQLFKDKLNNIGALFDNFNRYVSIRSLDSNR